MSTNFATVRVHSGEGAGIGVRPRVENLDPCRGSVTLVTVLYRSARGRLDPEGCELAECEHTVPVGSVLFVRNPLGGTLDTARIYRVGANGPEQVGEDCEYRDAGDILATLELPVIDA